MHFLYWTERLWLGNGLSGQKQPALPIVRKSLILKLFWGALREIRSLYFPVVEWTEREGRAVLICFVFQLPRGNDCLTGPALIGRLSSSMLMAHVILSNADDNCKLVLVDLLAPCLQMKSRTIQEKETD